MNYTTDINKNVLSFESQQQEPNQILTCNQRKFVDYYANDFLEEHKYKRTYYSLTGGAGTGKTYTLMWLMWELNQRSIECTFTATTNQACTVIDESKERFLKSKHCDLNTHSLALQGQTKTIHSLLGLMVATKEGSYKKMLVKRDQGKAAGYRSNLSNHQVLIIDESSMIDDELLAHILEAQEHYALNIIVVGDEWQLPPINHKTCPAFNHAEHGFILTENLRPCTKVPTYGIIALEKEVRRAMTTRTVPNLFDVFGSVNYRKDECCKDLGGLVYWGLGGWKSSKDKSGFIQSFHDKLRSTGNLKDCVFLCFRNKETLLRNNEVRDSSILNTIDKQGETDNTAGYYEGESLIAGEAFYIGKNKKNRRLCHTGTRFIAESVEAGSIDGVSGHFVKMLNRNFTAFIRDTHSEERYNERLNALKRAYKECEESNKARNWRRIKTFENQFHDIRRPYSLTVHKAQGQTYDHVFIDALELCSGSYDDAMRRLYVAVTRARVSLNIYGDIESIFRMKIRKNDQSPNAHLENPPFREGGFQGVVSSKKGETEK